MLPKPIPLSIVQTIIDRLAHDSSTTHRRLYPPPKRRTSTTLKACALVCRAWRPLAQHHLLRNIALEPPPEPVKPPAPKKPRAPSIWTTKSRKRKKPAAPLPPPPSPPPPPPSPVLCLLETMEADERWIHHVQAFRIQGSIWVISDPKFAQVLEVLSGPQSLKKLIWKMDCVEGCDCSYDISDDLRRSIEKLFLAPQFASIDLHHPCGYFLAEIFGKPMQRSSELLSTQVAPKTLTIKGGDCTRAYHLTPPGCQLRLDHISELTLINFEDVWAYEGDAGSTNLLIDKALESLDTLTWKFGATNGDDADLSDTQDNIKEAKLGRLKGLRTLNIEAWFNKYEYNVAAYYPNFKHYAFVPTILEQCLLSGTLETVNIVIEDDPFPEDCELGINGRFWHDITNMMTLDNDLAELLGGAIAQGHLKNVKIRIMVTGRKDALEEARYEIQPDDDDDGDSTGTDREEDDGGDTKRRSLGAKKHWLQQNPGKTEDDYLEAWCRDQGYNSDDERSFPSWRNFDRKVVSLFPKVQKIEGLNFEVVDTEDFVPS